MSDEKRQAQFALVEYQHGRQPTNRRRKIKSKIRDDGKTKIKDHFSKLFKLLLRHAHVSI